MPGRTARAIVAAALTVCLGSCSSGGSPTAQPSTSASPAALAFRVENGGLYVSGKDGSDPKLVTPLKTSLASWSPDGTRIAFTAQPTEGETHLYVATTDGTMHRLLRTEPQGLEDVAWAPDGTHLALHVQGATPYEADIAVLTIATGVLRRVTHGPGDDKGPAISPDGRWIAFKREGSSGASIWVVGWDGQHLHQVVPDRMLGAHPWWSPDGTTLVFNNGTGTVHQGGGSSHIFTVRSDGTHLRQLTSGSTFTDFHPSWASDGTIYFTRYVFSPTSMPFALYRMAADGTGVTPLTIPSSYGDLNDATAAS